jgi:Tfp pilus assembly PilM family ATPase
MTDFFERIKKYFTELRPPMDVFQIATRYIAGIHFSPKERKFKYHFVLPLQGRVIQPSFDKKNILDELTLEEKMKVGLERMHLSEGDIGCLVPELCLKAFLFSFDSLPSSQEEREKIIRWRVQKQFPSLTEDIRFSFESLGSENGRKILVSLAKMPVIQEYENLFSRLHLKVRIMSVPAFGLLNLFDREKENDVLIANIEEDSISMIALVGSEIVLYRLKPFMLDSRSPVTEAQKTNEIIKEIENTVQFIEDREKKKVQTIWIRLGLMDLEGDLFTELEKKINLPLKAIAPSVTQDFTPTERQLLAPLIGQVL